MTRAAMSANPTYLKDAWYAAAWDHEVSTKPLHRLILGLRVVLFRGENGVVGALEDRCAHRLVPLSCGKVAGDRLECAYHGLQFDVQGRCVANPHGAIPAAARVRHFALQERHGMVWLWHGDPARADGALIPDLSFIDDEQLNARRIRGYMPTKASYLLMADNILDLGHIEFLHSGTLGTEAVRAAPTRVRDDGRAIVVERQIEAEVLPEFMSREYGCVGETVKRLLSVRWMAPANLRITITVEPVDASRAAQSNYSCHLMTPETATTTHYFWANTRLGPLSADLDERKRQGLERVFATEDKPIVEAQQRNIDMDDSDDPPPVMLAVDPGLVRARRRLDDMLLSQARSAAVSPDG
jgi:phenylpropionate dioxygenase-like ring-hydroxylating dioxygenase large terminal subunit